MQRWEDSHGHDRTHSQLWTEDYHYEQHPYYGKATSSGTSTDKIQLALESFNCKGFKQCAHYITQRLLACDVLCLTETWLRPHELHLIEEVIKHDKAPSNYSWSVFTKSSMVDTPSDYCGRPFGGVAVICRNHKDLNYFSLETPSDRIITISVLDHQGNSLQSIICTYLPYFKGNDASQTESFVSTVGVLQSVIDNHTQGAPLKICGDMNVQLPRTKKLQSNWYRKPGFNVHSIILYDFLVCNNLLEPEPDLKLVCCQP